MANRSCPSCGGTGAKNTSISKGDSSNLCSNCGGSGSVPEGAPPFHQPMVHAGVRHVV